MADDKSKRSFPWLVLIGDGLLLLCALMGLTGSFLSLYSDPDAIRRVTSATWLQATALDRCAVNGDLLLAFAALFGLATLAAWSRPRFRIAAAGGLTALWAAVVLWNRTKVVRGAGIVVRDITTLFASRVYWGQVFSYKSGLRSAQEADAAQLFLLLALAGLALLLGWAVVRSHRWWAVLLLTLPPLLPGLLADLYPDWFSFMALAACWCAMLLNSLCRRAEPDRRGKLTLVTLSTAALTLALITLLFPREGYTRPAWALKAQDDLLNLTSHLSDYLPQWNNGPFQSTVTYVGAAEEVDLAHAGPLNYTGRTVLRVLSDYSGWTYLRGSSLAVYEDGIWKALPDGTYKDYWSGQEPEVSPLYLPATLRPTSRVYTITVDNIGATGACVYTPYFLRPQDANETGMLPVEDTYFARRQGQWSHTMTFADRDPMAKGADPAQSAALAYAEYVYDNYLDVPEDLRKTLEIYTSMWYLQQGVSLSYYEAVKSIRPYFLAEQFGTYLGALCQYDANTPAAPAGVDPVYYFLTESHRGYCMHYASAVTLMLRASGIPARYVSGFAADIPSGRRVNIPDRAAHAWVEVWVDGFGWYPVEVTPDAAFDWTRQPDMVETAKPEPTLKPTLEPTSKPTPEPTLEPTPEPTETPAPTDAPVQPTATLPGSGGNVDGPEPDSPGLDLTALFSVLKVAAPVIGVLLLIWSVQFAVKRFRAWRMSGTDANRSALVCYGYLCRLKRWGGKMDPKAVELAQKARFSQHTLTQEELGLLRGLVDRERARLCAASGPAKRLAFCYWWGRPLKRVE